MTSSVDLEYSDVNVSFLIDFSSKRVAYHFNNAPKNIQERYMTKVFTVRVKNYTETSFSETNKECSGEMDMEEFFKELESSRMKFDSFSKLFIEHGKNFLPRFEKWESITSK